MAKKSTEVTEEKEHSEEVKQLIKDSPINLNFKWGVEFEMKTLETDQLIYLKGYINNIDTIEEYDNQLVLRTMLTWGKFEDKDNPGKYLYTLKEIFETEDSSMEFDLPVYNTAEDVTALEKKIVDYSQGYIPKIKFVKFKNRAEQLKWSLKKPK